MIAVQLLNAQQGDSAFVKLMSSPVSATRKRMRKAKIENDSIAVEGRSLGEIYHASGKGRNHKSPLTAPVPTYAKWLGSFMNKIDAQVENERAKAEWAMRQGHATRRERPAAFARSERPAAIRERTNSRTSRNSWPSFRAAQLSAIYAAEGIAGLLSVNATPAEVNSHAGQFAEAA